MRLSSVARVANRSLSNAIDSHIRIFSSMSSSLPREFVSKPEQCAPFNFGPASTRDSIVYTCERPGMSSSTNADGSGEPGSIPESSVGEWVEFMKENNVKRVLTLLDPNEIELYERPLESIYKKHGFTFAHVPMGEPDAVDRVLTALEEASAANERIIAHCTHGMGRSGRVSAAWLVHKYGLSAEDATKEVMTAAETSSIVRLGNADKLSAWMEGGDSYKNAMKN